MTTVSIDQAELTAQVQAIYREVAANPQGAFHFELGRSLAERLGYPTADLDRVPAGAVASFAGVGYHFDLARPRDGETVVDLGSGSGLDTFVAALWVGDGGRVIGIDMTDEQLAKAERLRAAAGIGQITYLSGDIAQAPLPADCADVVISNGVINLTPDKDAVFREITRVLKPGGRLALSDIVTDQELPASVVGNTGLWAACIGGATPQEAYQQAIAAAGLEVRVIRDNPQYRFLSDGARNAQQQWGVKSISVLAVLP